MKLSIAVYYKSSMFEYIKNIKYPPITPIQKDIIIINNISLQINGRIIDLDTNNITLVLHSILTVKKDQFELECSKLEAIGFIKC